MTFIARLCILIKPSRYCCSAISVLSQEHQATKVSCGKIWMAGKVQQHTMSTWCLLCNPHHVLVARSRYIYMAPAPLHMHHVTSKRDLFALSKQLSSRSTRGHERQPDWGVCPLLQCFDTLVGCHISVYIPRAACIYHHPSSLQLFS